MSMLDPSRDFERPSLAGSQFEGYVIDTNDPEKRQRVKLRIPVLHRGIPDDKLPWSNIQSQGIANAGSGVGSVNVPEKFSKVIVSFASDDPHTPQYSSSPASDDVNKDNELLQEDYPNTQGTVDSYGNRISVNRATGDMTIAHKSGAIVHIDGAGNVTIAAAGKLSVASKGDMDFAAGGSMSLSASGPITINSGGNVQINEGSPKAPNIPGARSTPKIKDMSGKTDL